MRRKSGGSAILETALFLPVMMLLIVGMIQFGTITYTYYALRDTVYTAARYLAVQRNTNFCDPADPNIVAATNLAVTGTIDASGASLISNLTPAMLQVTTECVVNGAVGVCDTSGCGISPSLAERPDYVAVTIPNGYLVTPRLPFTTLPPIVLSPSALVAFGGTN
jgi:Flp pilus assembly protein TadG